MNPNPILCRACVTAALVGAALVAASAPAQSAEEATRVRILLVVDTEGFAARENGFAQDKDAMKRALKEALRDQNLEDRYSLDILHGKGATPQAVLDYYGNVNLSPDEALLFYYSGHGGTHNDSGHYLDMQAGRLSRSSLRQAMVAKRPRLLVLLTDCCANFDDDPPPAPPTGGPMNPNDAKGKLKSFVVKVARDGGRQNSLPGGRGEVLKELLFHSRGVIDITASKLGQMAFSDKLRGGYFTLTLTGLLAAQQDRFEAVGDGAVGWGAFFDLLQTTTQQNAGRELITQTPQALSIQISGGRR